MDLGANWDSTNTTLEVAYQIAAVVDWGQTLDIAKHPKGRFDRSPILGHHPSVETVNEHFPIMMGVHAAISAALPSDRRKIFQSITLGYEGSQIASNYGIGLKLGF